MEIEEERHPGSGLVLGHRGDDRYVNLCVTRVPQGIKATTPWRDITCKLTYLIISIKDEIYVERQYTRP